MEKVSCSTCNSSNALNTRFCSSCGHQLPTRPTSLPEISSKKENFFTKNKVSKILITAISFVVGYLAVHFLTSQKPSYDKMMMEVASELNKTCPVMVDADTRLDNTISLPNNIFQYNYTLVNMNKIAIDVEQLKKHLESTIPNYVRTNPQMKIQREHSTTLNYYYKDKLGNYLFTVSVTPAMYK
jgi:hypothetical protein